MKVLITGAAGFIGTHLALELLKHDYSLHLFDIDNVNLKRLNNPRDVYCFRGDIQQKESLTAAIEGVEVVFHLASLLGTDYLVDFPIEAVQVNTIGTLNILNAAKERKIKVIYLSLLPDWLSPYMITKRASEKFCQMFHEEFGTDTIVLRASHIYGKYQKWKPARKAIPNFIKSALNNEDITIFGSGNQLMDLLYVKDSVKALRKISNVSGAGGKTLELGSGMGISVLYVAEKIIEICKSKSRIIFGGKRPGEPLDEKCFSPANIKSLEKFIGKYSTTMIEDGLLQTINWYKENI